MGCTPQSAPCHAQPIAYRQPRWLPQASNDRRARARTPSPTSFDRGNSHLPPAPPGRSCHGCSHHLLPLRRFASRERCDSRLSQRPRTDELLVAHMFARSASAAVIDLQSMRSRLEFGVSLVATLTVSERTRPRPERIDGPGLVNRAETVGGVPLRHPPSPAPCGRWRSRRHLPLPSAGAGGCPDHRPPFASAPLAASPRTNRRPPAAPPCGSRYR